MYNLDRQEKVKVKPAWKDHEPELKKSTAGTMYCVICVQKRRVREYAKKYN